jgi:hypothetical protein
MKSRLRFGAPSQGSIGADHPRGVDLIVTVTTDRMRVVRAVLRGIAKRVGREVSCSALAVRPTPRRGGAGPGDSTWEISQAARGRFSPADGVRAAGLVGRSLPTGAGDAPLRRWGIGIALWGCAQNHEVCVGPAAARRLALRLLAVDPVEECGGQGHAVPQTDPDCRRR